MKNSHQGFIQFIIVIIGAVIALLYFGFDPVSIWNDIVLPLLASAARIFVVVIDFIVNITASLFGIFSK
jgi:hypothetical protein